LKLLLCGSREYPHPPKGGYWKFESEGSLKIFKGRYEPKLKIPEGLRREILEEHKLKYSGTHVFLLEIINCS